MAGRSTDTCRKVLITCQCPSQSSEMGIFTCISIVQVQLGRREKGAKEAISVAAQERAEALSLRLGQNISWSRWRLK